MADQIPTAPDAPGSPDLMAQRRMLARLAKYWWVFLITAVAWLVIAVVMFRFDTGSVRTLAWLVGFTLLFTGIEQLTAATAVRGGWKVAAVVFGLIFVAGAIWVLVNPGRTVASLALNLGLLLGLVGVLWIVEAVLNRTGNGLWWVGLLAGAAMLWVAWSASDLEPAARARALLALAGWWAILQAITSVVRAFQLKRMGALLRSSFVPVH